MMKHQTFTAPTLKEAMLRAKSSLGSDALIVNIRETRTKNGAKRIEVAARTSPRARTEVDSVNDFHEALGELRSLKTSWETTLASNERLRRQLEGLVTEIRQPRTVETQQPNITEIDHVLRGVEPHIARTIMARTKSRNSTPGSTPLSGSHTVIEEIVRIIPTCSPLWNRPKRTVAALIGATGVGKTTTVVKLAGQASLMHNRSVGIITLDSYRAGKVRTLESFAQAIGIEVREASDRAGLQAAAREFSKKDLILIDTPGLNPWNREKRAELLQILDFPDVEKHLVMSATSRTEDLRDIAADFEEGKLGSLIFTKLDESRTPATMLSATWDSGHKVSHLCDGQEIPDDIHAANSNLAKMLARVPTLRTKSEFTSLAASC
jgi:flagellar biosynthesis protein FlhF